MKTNKSNKISKLDQLLQKLITENAVGFSFFSFMLATIFSHLMVKDSLFLISQFVWFLAFLGTTTIALIPLIAAKQEIKRYKRSLTSSKD